MATADVVVGAKPGQFDPQWTAGDSVPFRVVIRDKDTQEVRDVSGTTFVAQVRRKASHSQAWNFTIDMSDAANGVLLLNVPTDANLPRAGVWDLKQIEGGEVVTLAAGTVRLDASVTEVA